MLLLLAVLWSRVGFKMNLSGRELFVSHTYVFRRFREVRASVDELSFLLSGSKVM